MAKPAPRTSPDHENSGWPPGVPYIIGNEGCERFSFYGMRSILTLYLARELYVRHPELGSAPETYAQSHYHLFVAAVYAFPLIGAVIADRLLGKYQMILYLSLVYCAGHACLAMFEGTSGGSGLGLALIAIGSGGIKPCVRRTSATSSVAKTGSACARSSRPSTSSSTSAVSFRRC